MQISSIAKLKLALMAVVLSLLPACHAGSDLPINSTQQAASTTAASNMETAQTLARSNARMPSGVPPAALDSEPLLPEPPASLWPFAQGAKNQSVDQHNHWK